MYIYDNTNQHLLTINHKEAFLKKQLFSKHVILHLVKMNANLYTKEVECLSLHKE